MLRRVVSQVSVGLLALGVGFFHAAGQDAPKANRNADVQKIADALKKGDAASAKAQVDALAKKIAKMEEVMNVCNLREKGGLGVGKIPGKIAPDGIELKLLTLSRNPLPDADLANQAEALVDMAYVIAAVADVTTVKPKAKPGPKSTPQNWATWSRGIRTGANDLAGAARNKDARAVQEAANKLNASCTSCHDAFRE